MTLEEMVRIFDAVRSGVEWKAKCPCHDDSTASLYFSEKGDKIVGICRAGCDLETVLAKKGLALKDLFQEHGNNGAGPGTIVSIYDYKDAAGKLAFQVVRYAPKTFRQRRPNPAGGWISHLSCDYPDKCARQGHSPLQAATPRVLYRLPEITSADPEDPIFIVEGEKDADRLTAERLVATTNPMGAEKWRTEYRESLHGRRVFIIPDNDEPGRRHAETVRASIESVVRQAVILNLPDLQPKGDVSNWLDAGHTITELIGLATEAAGRNPSKASRWPTVPEVLASMPPPGDRLSTGFPTLDTCLRGGLAPGRVYTTIGPPHRGKTALNSQFMLRCVKDHGAVGVGLYYDEGTWQAGLMMAEGLGFDRATLEDKYAESRADVEKSFEPIRLWMPNPSSEESELEAVDDGLVADGFSEARVVIVVDSIQRARCRAAANAKNAKDRADAIMLTLRGMVNRHRTWIILMAAKANRGSWANKNPALNFDPMAAGLDSSSIEYDSDFIAFLDGKIDTGIKYIVVKNRPGTGDTPIVKMHFERARASFAEVDQIVEEEEGAKERAAKKAAEHEQAVSKLTEKARKLLKKTFPKRLTFNFIRKAVGGKYDNVLEALEALEKEGSADWLEGPRDSQLWGWRQVEM